MSRFSDVTLVCVEAGCRAEFIWSARDQEFYEAQGYTQPKRCPECRARRKKERDNAQRHGNPGQARRRRGDRSFDRDAA